MFRKILFILLFPVCAFSQTYYVSNSGSDVANGLTPATAWQTCSRVTTAINAGVFGAGDSILFKRGDYFEPTSYPLIYIQANKINATTGSPVTFGSYGTGARPILSLENLTSYNVYNATVLFISGNNSNMVFRDMEWRGSFRAYPSMSAGDISGLLFDSIKIDGQALHDSQPTWERTAYCFDNAFMPSDGSVPTTEDSTDYGRVNNFEMRYSEILSMNRAFGMFASSYNFWIHHNKVLNSIRSFIDIGQCVKLKIEYNVMISDGTTNPKGLNSGGLKVQAQRATLDSSVIRGNLVVIKNGTAGTLAFNNPSGTRDSIYNNTFVMESASENNYMMQFGWEHDGGSTPIIQNLNMGLGSIINTFVANNVVLGGMLICEHGLTDVTYYDLTNIQMTENIDSMKAHGLWFKNNMMYSDNPDFSLGTRRVYAPATIVYTGGFFTSPAIASTFYLDWLTPANFNTLMNVTYGENNIHGDPLFVNQDGIDSSDFRLSGSSLGINSGAVIPDYTEDISGYPVPQTAGYVSIGCFQYVTNPPPVPTVTTDSAVSVTSSELNFYATVNPQGQSTLAYFQWGLDTTLSVPINIGSQLVGSGSADSAITGNQTGLLASTKYYYRVVAISAGGTSYGTVKSITTSATPVTPKRKIKVKR